MPKRVARQPDKATVPSPGAHLLAAARATISAAAALLRQKRPASTAERESAAEALEGALDVIDAYVRFSLPPGQVLAARELMTRPGETPPEKSARLRSLYQRAQDEALAKVMAILIRAGGDTTESARRKLGIGHIRAQRVRTLAVDRGLLKAHQRGEK